MVLHAERVGHGERHRGVAAVGHLDGLPHGRLGRRLLPEVALQVDDLRRGEVPVVEVDGAELGGHAQVGGHRPLGVLGDQDQAVAGDHLARHRRGRRRLEGDPDRPDVVGEGPPQAVVGDAAEEGGPSPERGHTGRGVGRRPARGLGGGSHAVVDGRRPHVVDEGHGPLDQVELAQVLVGGGGEDVDQRVADTGHVEARRRAGARPGRGVIGGGGEFCSEGRSEGTARR